MEGEQRKPESEEKTKNNSTRTGKVGTGGPEGAEAAHAVEAPDPAASNLTALEALVRGLGATQGRWPGEALKAAVARFKRMPKGGWQLCHSIFCAMFKCSWTLDKFKKSANFVIVSKNGNRCSRKRFVEESATRIKTIDEHLDEQTLYQARVHREIEQKYRILMQKSLERDIDQAEWTRKFTREETDSLVLDAVDRAAGAYATRHPPVTMSDIARQLQAAQLCYQEATARERKPSTWRISIEKKIAVNLERKKLLEISLAGGTLSESETREARRCMRELNLIQDLKRDAMEAISILNDRIRVFESKLASSEKRIAFRIHNRRFELYRGRFYKQLTEEHTVAHSVPQEEIAGFWSTMWNERERDKEAYDEYLLTFVPGTDEQKVFPSAAEFDDIVRYLPNWKAAGPDGVYSYFIKHIKSLHDHLYKIIRQTCLDGEMQEPWFYRGITYLIPKGTPQRGSDFRPITCMSNLYKLTTRCVAQVMRAAVDGRGLLADNQLGTVAGVQGAKEQALLNVAVNREHRNTLRTTWIDVKKAFDSVDHTYLLECIDRLELPAWILSFLRGITQRWEVSIRSGRDEVLRKRIKRGILQGDSLSPLLFVLCLDPLSRRLNSLYPKVTVPTNFGMHATNHLLFVDDLKLLAESDSTLALMTAETQRFFDVVGLEVNRKKSATNSGACAEAAVFLEGKDGYKYLGVIEDNRSRPSRESYEKLQTELYARVERLCKTKLNGKNLMKAINEHGVNLINYYVGLLRLEPKDYVELDSGVRRILSGHGIHLQPACLERLYLPRTELGRGLHNIEMRSEQMLLQLSAYLAAKAPISTRCAAILKVEAECHSHLGSIAAYLQVKYGLRDGVDGKSLLAAQAALLYSEIEKKTRHAKLYNARANEQASISDSSIWLKRGNIRPQDEARYCYLQDRNMFGGETGMCPHCQSRVKTVDHLATQCKQMLYHDYTRRHNEAVRYLHLRYCIKYGIKALPRMRSHSVQEIVSNENAEIRVDTRVPTGIKIQANKPDILIHDEKRREIILVEVGITSQDRLVTVETEKKYKYDVLANKLGQEYKCKTRIIPYVMTWDRVVTKHHKRYVRDIRIPESVEVYIQTIVLKKTLESISLGYHRGAAPDDGAKADSALRARAGLTSIAQACTGQTK